MKTGKLTERVEFYQDQDTDDGYGGSIPNEVSYWNTWANCRQSNSIRSVESGQTILKDGYIFTLRYRADKQVSKDMLIKYRDRWFVINSILPGLEGKETLIITAVYRG